MDCQNWHCEERLNCPKESMDQFNPYWDTSGGWEADSAVQRFALWWWGTSSQILDPSIKLAVPYLPMPQALRDTIPSCHYIHAHRCVQTHTCVYTFKTLLKFPVTILIRTRKKNSTQVCRHKPTQLQLRAFWQRCQRHIKTVALHQRCRENWTSLDIEERR